MEKTIEELSQSELPYKIKENFINIQKAWNEHDLNTLALLESSDLFEEDAKRMYLLELNEERQVKKDIVFHSIVFLENYIDNDYEYIKAKISVTLEDYIYKINNNEVVKGIKDYNVTKTYQVLLKRREKEKSNRVVKCVACNADVLLNAVGKCEYCGTVHYNKNYNWVFDKIKEID